MDERKPDSSRSASPFVRKLVVGAIVVALVAATAVVSIYWLKNRPKAERRPPQAAATLVKVAPVSASRQTATVRAMGTVVPARSIDLAARVSGEVVDVSEKFIPGGRFEAGETILQVEPKDYELIVRQREDDLARARADLKIEMGQQAVALQEYELLGKDVDEADSDLLLRKPQLATARADVSKAEAALEQAKLDLARSKIVAPFNAIVQSRLVDLGAHVAVGAPLVSLVGTDEYWVEVSVPMDQLRWIDIPQTPEAVGSSVRVYHEAAWGADQHRSGAVKRLMAEVEPDGRMARLLVAVSDPMDAGAADRRPRPLILGSYVSVEIQGRDLDNVIRVPRSALRDGNAVWVMAADDTLDIREVRIVFSDGVNVYVSDGLADGDRLVTSDLSAPAAAMALRTGAPAGGEGGKSVAKNPPQPPKQPDGEGRR